MIDPAIRVGLVDGDNPDNRAGGTADLNVKRPSCGREAQEKTTWAISVGWVGLNDLVRCDGFAQFLYRALTKKRLIDGMLGELELVTLELSLDAIEVNH